jgi:hypothetical protein
MAATPSRRCKACCRWDRGFRRTKAGLALVGAAIAQPGGMGGFYRFGRFAGKGDHDAVSGASFLAVERRADRGMAIRETVARPAHAVTEPTALFEFALDADGREDRVVKPADFLPSIAPIVTYPIAFTVALPPLRRGLLGKSVQARCHDLAQFGNMGGSHNAPQRRRRVAEKAAEARGEVTVACKSGVERDRGEVVAAIQYRIQRSRKVFAQDINRDPDHFAKYVT